MIRPIDEMEILRNERPEPNVFQNKHNCDFCDDFVPQVITFEIAVGQTFKTAKQTMFVCSGCLQKMIDRLNKNMVDNFQKDFEESRKGDI